MGNGAGRTNVEAEIADELSSHSERTPEPDDFAGLRRHPLYFALSRPIGTSTTAITEGLRAGLTSAGYRVVPIKLSELISRAYEDVTGTPLPPTSEHGERLVSSYRGLMRAGDMLRALDTALVAKIAILEINRRRGEHIQEALLSDKQGVAYIITHLMHPDEVRTMRSVYGARFFLIAANAPRLKRQDYLASEFGKLVGSDSKSSRVSTDIGSAISSEVPAAIVSDALELARELIAIDAGVTSSIPHLDPKKRLNVDDTFQLADLFVRSRSEMHSLTPSAKRTDEGSASHVSRLLAQIFSNPFGTPTSEESAMASAFLAAKSSVALGRSVGAALVDPSGSVVSTGWNEVAKPSGGPYRETDHPDHRDHMNGFDPSDASRVDAIRSFLEVLLSPTQWKETLPLIAERYPISAEWLAKLAVSMPAEGLGPSRDAIAGLGAIESFDSTRIMHLIEFGRSVHAEVAALSDAFRRGVGQDCRTIYVTTFPCHECTRNLISFGIREVVFVEPYGKSMAEALYRDEVSVFADDLTSDSSKMSFIPFAGLSPSRLDELFSPVQRKYGLNDQSVGYEIGGAVKWNPSKSSLRPSLVGYPPGYDPKLVIPEFEVSLLSSETIVAQSVSKKLSNATWNLRNPDDSSPISKTDS